MTTPGRGFRVPTFARRRRDRLTGTLQENQPTALSESPPASGSGLAVTAQGGQQRQGNRPIRPPLKRPAFARAVNRAVAGPAAPTASSPQCSPVTRARARAEAGSCAVPFSVCPSPSPRASLSLQLRADAGRQAGSDADGRDGAPWCGCARLRPVCAMQTLCATAF